MLRKILRLGKYSAVISIPKELMKKLNFRRGQKVDVTAKRNKILIKDSR